MVSRPSPLPNGGITIHAIGDTHVGPTLSNEPWRLDVVSRDTARIPISPAGVVQLGDGCNNNPATDTAILSNFLDRFGSPWYAVMGNHDINDDVQTPAQWAARLGYPAQNYTVDLDGVRLVMFSPSAQYTNYEVAPSDSLTWLDAAIGGTTNPVIVCCHYPLYGTALYSDSVPWYIRTAGSPGNSNDVLNVLATHSNVKAWISGHLHSPVTDPGLVVPVVAGSHRLAAINASCIWYCLPPPAPYPLDARDTINTLFVTLFDDRVEVRIRDHGAGLWAAPNGNRVFTVYTDAEG